MKYELGFYNQIHDKPIFSGDAKYINVYDICDEDGKIIAFAISLESAKKIIFALNNLKNPQPQ